MIRTLTLAALLLMAGCTFITGVPFTPPVLCLGPPIIMDAPSGSRTTVYTTIPCDSIQPQPSHD